MKVLDPLILDCCAERRDVEIKALTPEPVRPVLVEGILVFFPDRVKQGQFVLPLRPDDPICGEPCPDLCAGQPPVRAVTVFFFIERQVHVPPLEKGHDGPCKAEKESQL